MNQYACTPVTVALPGRLEAEIVPVQERGIPLVRLAASAELYFIAGAIAVPAAGGGIMAIGADGLRVTALGGYVGQSAAFAVARARVGASYRQWVERTSTIEPTAVLLVRSQSAAPPMSEPFRLLIEALMVTRLNDLYYLTNIRGSAPTAARQLTRDEARRAVRLAGDLTQMVVTEVFGGYVSAVLGGSQREQLCRLVQQAGRGLDAGMVLQLGRQAGLRLTGPSPTQTVRRDLAQRSRADRTSPKIHVAWYGGRRIFYSPHLTKREALDSYKAYLPAAGGLADAA